MTTTPTHEDERTPEQAIREAAWQNAVQLYQRWEGAMNRAEGGPGGNGYISPGAGSEVRFVRTLLEEVVAEHGFEDTRVDILGLSYAERLSASWACPAADRPRCTHDSDTCPVHWGRRQVGLVSSDCGVRS